MGKCKPRNKMPIGDRAKQFAPFSPLSGLEKALAEQEKKNEKRRYPDADAMAEINATLNELKRGDSATVFFYNSSEHRYEQSEGQIQIIDELHKRLFIGGMEICFRDILEIVIDGRREEN